MRNQDYLSRNLQPLAVHHNLKATSACLLQHISVVLRIVGERGCKIFRSVIVDNIQFRLVLANNLGIGNKPLTRVAQRPETIPNTS